MFRLGTLQGIVLFEYDVLINWARNIVTVHTWQWSNRKLTKITFELQPQILLFQCSFHQSSFLSTHRIYLHNKYILCNMLFVDNWWLWQSHFSFKTIERFARQERTLTELCHNVASKIGNNTDMKFCRKRRKHQLVFYIYNFT